MLSLVTGYAMQFKPNMSHTCSASLRVGLGLFSEVALAISTSICIIMFVSFFVRGLGSHEVPVVAIQLVG